MKRIAPALWFVFVVSFAAIAACKSDYELAEERAQQGVQALAAGDHKAAIAAFDEALRLNPTLEAAFVGRAKALVKGGDERRAAESLAKCHEERCGNERRALATGLIDGAGKPPFADKAGLARYLRLFELAGKSSSCALVTAIARVDGGDEPRRKLLASAVEAELKRSQTALDRRKSADAPEIGMGKAIGAGLAGTRDCQEIYDSAMRLVGSVQAMSGDTDLASEAFDVGFLTAELPLLARPAKANEALARMPLRSAGDVTAYLDAMAKAGYARDCAVFTAILRVERLPARQRAAARAPLKAAIAALAPKDGARNEVRLAGRKTIAPDAIASGAQSCEELEKLYGQLAAAATRVQVSLAALGGGDAGGTSMSIDRAAFMYTALRTRFEHPMSAREIAQQLH